MSSEAVGFGVVGAAFEASAGRSVRSMDRLGKSVERGERRFERAQDVLGRTRSAVGAVVEGVQAVGRLAGGAREREEAAVRLRTVLVADDDAVEAELGRALDHARELVLSRGSLHGETELLGINYTLSEAGFDAASARAGTGVASRVATVTRGAPEEVAGVMATSLETLGGSLEGTDAERLAQAGDILTRAQLAFAVENFAQLGEGMKQVAGVADVERLDMKEAAVFVGALNEVGAAGGAGGAAGGAVLRQLGKAADTLGFAVARDEDGGLDLMATLERVGAALERFGNDDARGAAMQDAFGAEGKAVQLVVEKMLPKMGQQLAEMDAGAGHADEQFARFRDSGFGAVKLLQNSMNVLRNVLGGAPAVQEWAEGLTGAVDGLGKVVEGAETLQKNLNRVGELIKATGLQRVYDAAVRAGSLGGAMPTTRRGRFRAAGRGVRGGLNRGGARLGAAVGRGGARLGAAAGRGAVRMGGALKTLGRVAAAALGVVGFKVLAIGALIGGAVYLVVKYWEPIKGFFMRLWTGVVTAAKAAWAGVTATLGPVVEFWGQVFTDFSATLGSVVGAWGKVFTDFSWANVGSAIMETLAAGVKAAVGLPGSAVRTAFGWVRDLLPFSDAQTGPLSGLTASGAAMLRTVGDGVRKAGPDGLRRPLARELAAASTALALAPAAFGAPAPGVPPAASPPAAARTAPAAVDQSRIYVTIHQQPREDAAALVDRLLAEIERRRGVRRRAALHDDY